MSIKRYLLYASYLGKPFIGAQRQKRAGFPRIDDPSTVQGRVETGLKLLNPHNEPIVYLSSRTDAGVSAFCTTMHVDLIRHGSVVYEPQTITICLNKHFDREDIPIRILKSFWVPQSFNCRHNAISRTYLYRMAVINADSANQVPHLALLPIEEIEKCHFVFSSTFNFNYMREAAKLFVGNHDFRTFMWHENRSPDKITRRFVNRVDIFEGKNPIYSPYSWPSVCDIGEGDIRFYDIYIQASGFLYRQVRRMVATLIAVAQGKLLSSDIKSMLEVPSFRSWDSKIRTVPAKGLYLCEVEYSEADKATFSCRIAQ